MGMFLCILCSPRSFPKKDMMSCILTWEPTKRFKHLHAKIDLACEVYNYFVRFCRHYFHLYHKTVGTQTYTLQKVLTHLKSLKFYEHWCSLNSQTLQDILGDHTSYTSPTRKNIENVQPQSVGISTGTTP